MSGECFYYHTHCMPVEEPMSCLPVEQEAVLASQSQVTVCEKHVAIHGISMVGGDIVKE